MKYVSVIVFFFLPLILSSQNKVVSFGLYDEVTRQPVSDAHVFISNATYGTISNVKGECIFEISEIISSEELIISHILYDTKVLRFSKYKTLTIQDSVFVVPNNFDLDEIMITKKRGRKWKRKLKRFQKAFLGEDKSSKQTKILNPEVLRFEEVDGVFRTTAVDMIQIENKYLGYFIDFKLKELTIESDKTTKYFGYLKYKENENKINPTRIAKRRKEKYVNSLRHFMINLIDDNLEEANYKISLANYKDGEFEHLGAISASDIVTLDTLSGLYHIRFNEFLEVKHLDIRQAGNQVQTIKLSVEERRKFGDMQTAESATVGHAVSRLYKISPSLIVDKYGKIYNHKHVREYGFWAEQRMSSFLPLDYGVELKPEIPLTKKAASLKKDTKITALTVAKDLISGDINTIQNRMKFLEENWNDQYLLVVLDIMRVMDNESLTEELRLLIKSKVGSNNYYEGLQSLWNLGTLYGDDYSKARAEVLKNVDPKFEAYFQGRPENSLINMNEIVWGGVKQDGIPPLRYPKLIDGDKADYLDDEDIVFAIKVNGIPRAYPKRILAWHEMFIDTIGGVDIAGVYCTLCGTMIGYDTNIDGKRYALGTSGFLYRSNKLMYDEGTQSLWSTIDGKPVAGALAGNDLELDVHPIITTTWGEWKLMHPDSKVLSLDTGYKRDYSEGAAYSEYFGTDELMFPVPLSSKKAKNKEEVLVIRSDGFENDPLAISIKHLKRKGIYTDKIYWNEFVAISEKSGASRAYDSKGFLFESYKKGVLKDSEERIWQVTEEALIGPDGEQLKRLPSHNAFWFAWHNMYPETRLVK